jgi:hypothetical protein
VIGRNRRHCLTLAELRLEKRAPFAKAAHLLPAEDQLVRHPNPAAHLNIETAFLEGLPPQCLFE